MGHIFGMLVELFEFFIEPRKGTPWGAKNVSVTCKNGTNTIVRLPNNVEVGVNEDGISYYKVVTYTLGQVARNYFDCNTMDGVRLTYSDDLCFTDSNWHPVSIYLYGKNYSNFSTLIIVHFSQHKLKREWSETM